MEEKSRGREVIIIEQKSVKEEQIKKIYYSVPELVAMGLPRNTIENACHTESARSWLVQGGKHKKRAIHLEKFMRYLEKQRC